MKRSVAALSAFVLGSLLHPVAAQVPKTERSVLGSWELKAVTIDGEKIESGSTKLAGLLSHAGGVKMGMLYRIDRKKISMNDDAHVTEYEFVTETKALGIEYPNEKGEDGDLSFSVKFLDKGMLQLSYKEKKLNQKEKKVVMTFAPED